MELIKISIGSVNLVVDPLDTPTAMTICSMLPHQSVAQTWGEEVYFNLPASCEVEKNAKDVVLPGEIAFWVQGQAIAIGFGPTPISQNNEIRLAAKINVWAHALSDVRELKRVKPGDKVAVMSLLR